MCGSLRAENEPCQHSYAVSGPGSLTAEFPCGAVHIRHHVIKGRQVLTISCAQPPIKAIILRARSTMRIHIPSSIMGLDADTPMGVWASLPGILDEA
jgi:hypothetical protein